MVVEKSLDSLGNGEERLAPFMEGACVFRIEICPRGALPIGMGPHRYDHLQRESMHYYLIITERPW